MDEWVEKKSERKHTKYWYNINTGESSWCDPRLETNHNSSRIRDQANQIIQNIFNLKCVEKCKNEIRELVGFCQNNDNISVLSDVIILNALSGNDIFLLSKVSKKIAEKKVPILEHLVEGLQIDLIDTSISTDCHSNISKIKFLGALSIDFKIKGNLYENRIFASILEPKIDIIHREVTHPNIEDDNELVQCMLSHLRQISPYIKCFVEGFSSDLLDTWFSELNILMESPGICSLLRSGMKDIIECCSSSFSYLNTPQSVWTRRGSFTEEQQGISFENLPEFGEYTVILLLGAPGIGKSTLGMLMKDKGVVYSFLDTGNRLRRRGDIRQSERLSTKSRRQSVCAAAQQMLCASLQDFFRSDGSKPMVVTYVKEARDVYDFLKAVKTASYESGKVSSIQAWHLRDDNYVYESILHAEDIKRMKKWMRNNSSIMEIFASQGLLAECSKVLNGRKDVPIWDWKFVRWVPSFTRLPLVHDRDLREKVLTEMRQVLGVNELSPAIPGTFVQNTKHIEWLSNPGRYQVAHKADGVRYFLYVDENEQCWFVNRIGTVYSPYDLKDMDYQHYCDTSTERDAVCEIPGNTIIDGELLLISSAGVETWTFLVFDILCFSRECTWYWPYTDRINKLTESISMQSQISYIKVKVKNSKSFSMSNINELLDAQINNTVGYPTDGLVFTPEMSYEFGLDCLLLKWQSPKDVKADLDFFTLSAQTQAQQGNKKRTSSSNSANFERRVAARASLSSNEPLTESTEHVVDTSPGYIYECVWSDSKKVWIPHKVRFDKCGPNSEDCVSLISDMMTNKTSMISLRDSQESALSAALQSSLSKPIYFSVHPAHCMSFDSLMTEISHLINTGSVECNIDNNTGLHVYSYMISKDKEQQEKQTSDRAHEDICRGLILHPSSKTVVATAFVRFYKLKDTELSERKNRIVRASVKYDGSLIIAFLWKGELHTSTRRRMDSEQALWAKQYLRGSVDMMAVAQQGWTYLFELIGGDNRHTVDYNSCQRLVFLSAFTTSGEELSDEDRTSVARRLHVQTPSSLYGRLEEFVNMTVPHSEGNMISLSGEGLVVEDPVDGKRFKLINTAWSRASAAVKLLVHPSVVWNAMRMNRLDQLFFHPDLPKHARMEVETIADYITRIFESPYFSPEYINKAANDGLDIFTDDAERFSVREVMQFMIANTVTEENIHTLLLQAISQLDASLLTKGLTLADRNNISLSDFIMKCFLSFNMSEIISPTNNRTVHNRNNKDSILRLLLLHYARPLPSGEVPGYVPATWLAQTYAKGWQKIADINARTMSWGETGLDSTASIVLNKVQRVSNLVFSFLAPSTTNEDSVIDANRLHMYCELPRITLVCRSWHMNILDMFLERISTWKVSVLTERRLAKERMLWNRISTMSHQIIDRCYDSDDYFADYDMDFGYWS